jgi:XTP/dITP diphosphohydrolase
LAPLKVTLCSANEGKLVEVREALPAWEVELLDPSDYPEEDGATYVANARIKARYGRSVGPADRWMLADDSGLELAALGGRPGVQTARWAEGRHVERALAALDGAADRSGRYEAELVLLSPDGQELRGTGVLEGAIAREPAGRGGFGFDPVFVPRGETQTVAELGDAWKAVHSHRALAAKVLVERLLHLTSGV